MKIEKINWFKFFTAFMFIAIIIMINVFTAMLTERFFIKADLTAAGIYTISGRALEFLQNINDNVDIIVLAEESAWLAHHTYVHAVNILQNYAAETGGRIRVQYVNPDLNTFDGPGYNNTLSVLRDSHAELENMENGDIIFLSSRRAARINVMDLFAYSYNSSTNRYVTSGIKADQELVSSLGYVLNEKIARAVFTSNHQESGNAFIKDIFNRNGYASRDINLATEDIPEDTLIVISTGPKTDFLGNEIEKLERFLVGGGNVMILFDFDVVSLPALESFMEQFGITVDSKIIFDENHTYIPQLGVIGAQVVAGGLPFTAEAEAISTSSLPLGTYLPRPLKSPWAGDSQGSITLFPMVRTFSASSYAKELSTGEALTFEREANDETGPFVLAYNARMTARDAEGSQVYANLIIGGANSFDDNFMSSYGNSFLNFSFISGIAYDLNPFGEGIYIPVKALSGTNMPVSSEGARSVLIYMVIGLPLAITAAGIVVWRKRKNL